jgi:hypothetical protein
MDNFGLERMKEETTDGRCGVRAALPPVQEVDAGSTVDNFADAPA